MVSVNGIGNVTISSSSSAIFSVFAANFSINNVHFERSKGFTPATSAIVINSLCFNGCSIRITNCSFSNLNASLGSGAAIGASFSGYSNMVDSMFLISNCVFRDCNADKGGAIAFLQTGGTAASRLNVVLQDNSFITCSSDTNGGAVLIESSVALSNSRFEVNSSNFTSCSANGNYDGGSIALIFKEDLANISII